MYQGEEVPAAEERLAFISGFTGSAGFGLILGGRQGCSATGAIRCRCRTSRMAITGNVLPFPRPGLAVSSPERIWKARASGDPRLVTVNGYARLAKQLTAAGGSLVAEEENPIDALWHGERPAPPVSRPFRMPDRVAGKSMTDKLAELDDRLAQAGAMRW